MIAALLLMAATPQAPAPPTDNAEMARLFGQDQADRQGTLAAVDWNRVNAADAARRARTKALLDAGKLVTGADFYHAAFVFQHGGAPEDFLLAHGLAIAAAAKGAKDASWIAAATMDRYLQAIGRPQIYGTQFSWKENGPVTQEPYDRALVGEGLRAVMGVPSADKQEERRRALEAERVEAAAKRKP